MEFKEEFPESNVVGKFKKVVLSSKRRKLGNKESADIENQKIEEEINETIEDFAVGGYNINFNVVDDFNFDFTKLDPFHYKRALTHQKSSAIKTLQKNIARFYCNRLSWNKNLIEINTFWQII